MAATPKLPHSFAIRQISKHGVISLWGFGVRVRMQNGHLECEWGVGLDRYRVRLARVGHGVSRIICLGADGFVTLASLEWMAEQDISFVLLERDGKIRIATGRQGTSDARLRRAQATLPENIAMKIARDLVDRKLAGQAAVARDCLLNPSAAAVIDANRLRVWRSAETPGRLRYYESQAAAGYWQAFEKIPVTFQKKDLKRIPSHWQTWGPRLSPLAIRSPRSAVTPAQCCLNYLYAILESEATIAVATLGLDPAFGILHADAGLRSSLALDIMEPCRPQVEIFLLELMAREPMERAWFFERADGNVRLTTAICKRFNETAPVWTRAIAPIAEDADRGNLEEHEAENRQTIYTPNPERPANVENQGCLESLA